MSHVDSIEDGTGDSGKSTRQQMYDFVETQHGIAYAQSGSSRATLAGAVSPRGTQQVRTLETDTETDNLLKLPECL